MLLQLHPLLGIASWNFKYSELPTALQLGIDASNQVRVLIDSSSIAEVLGFWEIWESIVGTP